MLSILIVEDEPILAQNLRELIELNPLYAVTAIAEDSMSAYAAIAERRPDLALVDLQLAHGSTGFSVAARLAEMDIPCLFTSGNAPSFPIPDLAFGCLVKPYSEEDLVRALKAAEDLIRGRERLRPSRPENLRLYAEESAAAEIAAPALLPVSESSTARRRLSDRIARFWRQLLRRRSYS